MAVLWLFSAWTISRWFGRRGLENFHIHFIVIPEITASLGLGWVMSHLLNNNRIAAVVAGGIFFIVAAMLTQRVEDLYDLRHPSGSLPTHAVAAKP